MRSAARLGILIVATIVAFAIVNVALFWSGWYRAAMDPASSTVSFERTIAGLDRVRTDAARDVVVVGDSRIYAGFDPKVARRAGRGSRFLNAGVPGTDPRCWYYLLRAVDPDARRFRALVIPVDSYTDDTSAIGSLDAAYHVQDLHSIVFRTRPGDLAYLARSFDGPALQRDVAFDMLLRGPIMRDDIQALLADPGARLDALRASRTDRFDPFAVQPFATSLSGLRVDFAAHRIDAPAWVTPAERVELEKQILRPAQPSSAYGSYRLRWLGPIVRRYAAAHVPIVFVRIPARPVHRAEPATPSGSLVQLARSAPGLVRLLPQRGYVALERPSLFADHDHLDIAGGRLFSALLGHDVDAALARSTPVPAAGSPLPLAATTPARRNPLGTLGAALEIGTPMPFASIDFALYYGIVSVLFVLLPRTARMPLLLVASYYFYLRWNGWYVVFLATLTGTDYIIARRLEDPQARHRRALLTLGVGLNVAFLAVFKYVNFATSTLFGLAGRREDPWLLAIVVPIGISFHTFQSISYLVDVAQGRVAASRRPLDYALYISFFPQLLAGPIVRAGRFLGELAHWRRPDAERVQLGLREIALGLVKKLVIADQLAPTVDRYFAAPTLQPSASAAWSATFAFALQIFFDFAGYSDIAIGCARLLGFDFPANFNRPYFAASIGEFWRRWHITLSTWLRDYLYIPLGGDRAGRARTARNLLLTMLLGGLWHGASWTFVAWGGYFGLLLCVEHVLGLRSRSAPAGGVRLARIALTFLLVTLGWVLFRAQSFGDAAFVYRAMIAGGIGSWTLPAWPLVVVAGALVIGIAQERGARWNWERRPLAVQIGALTGLLVLIEAASWPGASPPFIYFKF